MDGNDQSHLRALDLIEFEATNHLALARAFLPVLLGIRDVGGKVVCIMTDNCANLLRMCNGKDGGTIQALFEEETSERCDIVHESCAVHTGLLVLSDAEKGAVPEFNLFVDWVRASCGRIQKKKVRQAIKAAGGRGTPPDTSE